MKSYLMSFTPLVGNKAKFTLALMQQATVWNKNKGLVSFLPWGRYAAEVLPDAREGVKVSKRANVFEPARDATIDRQVDADVPEKIQEGTAIASSVTAPQNLTHALHHHIVGVVENYLQGENIYDGNYDDIDKAVRVFVAHEVDEIIAEQASHFRESVQMATTPIKLIKDPLEMTIQQVSRLNAIRYGKVTAEKMEGTMRTSIGEIQSAIEGSVYSKGEAFTMSFELMYNAVSLYTGYNVELDGGMLTAADEPVLIKQDIATIDDSTDADLIKTDTGIVSGTTDADLIASELMTPNNSTEVEFVSTDHAKVSGTTEADVAGSEPVKVGGSTQAELTSGYFATPVNTWESHLIEHDTATVTLTEDFEPSGFTVAEPNTSSDAVSPINFENAEPGKSIDSNVPVKSDLMSMFRELDASSPVRSELMDNSKGVDGDAPMESELMSNESGAVGDSPLILSEAELNPQGLDTEIPLDVEGGTITAARGDGLPSSLEHSSIVSSYESIIERLGDNGGGTIVGNASVLETEVSQGTVFSSGTDVNEQEKATITFGSESEVVRAEEAVTSMSNEAVVIGDTSMNITGGNTESVINELTDTQIIEKIIPITKSKNASGTPPKDGSEIIKQTFEQGKATKVIPISNEESTLAATSERPVDISHTPNTLLVKSDAVQDVVSHTELHNVSANGGNISIVNERTTTFKQGETPSDIITQRSVLAEQGKNAEDIIKQNIEVFNQGQSFEDIITSHTIQMHQSDVTKPIFMSVLEDPKPVNRAMPVVKTITELFFNAEEVNQIINTPLEGMQLDVGEASIFSTKTEMVNHPSSVIPVNNSDFTVGVHTDQTVPVTTEKLIDSEVKEGTTKVINEQTVPFTSSKGEQTVGTTRVHIAEPSSEPKTVLNQHVESLGYTPTRKMQINDALTSDIEKHKSIAPPSTDDEVVKKASAQLSINETEGTAQFKVAPTVINDHSTGGSEKRQTVQLNSDTEFNGSTVRPTAIADTGELDFTKTRRTTLEGDTEFNSNTARPATLPSHHEINFEKHLTVTVGEDDKASGYSIQPTVIVQHDSKVDKNSVATAIDGTTDITHNPMQPTDLVGTDEVLRDIRYRSQDSPLDKAKIESTLPGSEPEDDDLGTGIPGDPPPWEKNKAGKIWLIQNKHYPAWNSWSPKKTR